MPEVLSVERKRMKTLWLQNADKKLVLSATIACQPDNDAYWLSVKTVYGNRPCDYYKSLTGAKMDFGKKFQKGGKWSEEVPG